VLTRGDGADPLTASERARLLAMLVAGLHTRRAPTGAAVALRRQIVAWSRAGV